MTATNKSLYCNTSFGNFNQTVLPTDSLNMSSESLSTSGFTSTTANANTTTMYYLNVSLTMQNGTLDEDSAARLQALNQEVVFTLIPAIVVVALLMVIGLIGNPMAIYFYCFKMKPSPSNMFIVVLAISDFLFCLICLPVEITDLIQFYNFENEFVCKLRVVHYVTNFVSSFILISIAVDRYRRIIVPYKKQISLKMAKVITLITVIISVIFSFPVPFIYGIENVIIEKEQLIGRDCTLVRQESHKLYILIFLFSCFFFFLMVITSLTVVYTIIGRALQKSTNKLKKHAKLANRKSEAFISDVEEKEKGSEYSCNRSCADSELRKTSTKCSTLSSTDEGSNTNPYRNSLLTVPNKRISVKDDIMKNRRHTVTLTREQSAHIKRMDFLTLNRTQRKPSLRHSQSMLNITEEEIGSTGEAILTKWSRHRASTGDILTCKMNTIFTHNNSGNTVHKERKKKKNRDKLTRHYTMTYLSISVVFIISYIPFLGLSLWQVLSTKYEPNILSSAELVTLQIFFRTYVFHSVANPIVYGFMSTEFRRTIKNACRRKT